MSARKSEVCLSSAKINIYILLYLRCLFKLGLSASISIWSSIEVLEFYIL